MVSLVSVLFGINTTVYSNRSCKLTTLSPYQGSISTAVELNRETVDRYTLTVAAADMPPTGDPSRTGIATVSDEAHFGAAYV